MNRNTIPFKAHFRCVEPLVPLVADLQPQPRRHECACEMCRPVRGMELQPPVDGHLGLFRGRTFVIDDHENLCGGPNAPSYVSSAIWKILKDTCSLDTTSHIRIGLSGFSAANWMTSLPFHQMRLVVGDGPDGADHALLDSIDARHVAARFKNVIIASNDHIFADLASEFSNLGLLVCNVTSSRSGASKKLAEACQIHVRLKVGSPVRTPEWVTAA